LGLALFLINLEGNDMSDKCPLCGSKNITSGYGYAGGPLGAYTFCDDHNELIEYTPDLEGLDEEECLRLTEMADKWREKFNKRIAAIKEGN
jgi:hypothetical protein